MVHNVAVTCLLLFFNLISSQALAQMNKESKDIVKINPDEKTELFELRFEKKIQEEMEKSRSQINDRISSELGDHRKYLTDLNDRFYNHLQLWIPIFSGVIAILIAIFMWQFGKTRQEAFEAAQASALAKATELAQKKIEEIIIPDRIVSSVMTMTEETIKQIKVLKTELTQEVEDELKAARDDVVRNKHDVIVQALDETMKEKFSKELDVLTRIKVIEDQIQKISEKSQMFEKVFVEYLTRELSDQNPLRSWMSASSDLSQSSAAKKAWERIVYLLTTFR